MVTPECRGQAPIERVIPDPPACGSCAIRIRPVAQLGSLHDSLSAGLFAVVARDAEGRFYVGPARGFGEILVFTPDGRFLRTLGRSGEGPGEFSTSIARIDVWRGNTLIVLDRNLRRLSALTRDGELVATLSLPFHPPMDFWPATERAVLVQGWADRDAYAGRRRPYHLYTWEQDLEASIGEEWPAPVRSALRPEVAAAPRGGDFWTARRRQYALARWNLETGRLETRLIRNASWFPADTSRTPDRPSPWVVKPAPWIEGVHDAGDRIWVIVYVSDAEWRPRAFESPEELLTPENTQLDDLFDTVLEAVDPERGVVLARHRFDEAFRFVRASGEKIFLYSYGLDDPGVPVIRVWNTRLVQP